MILTNNKIKAFLIFLLLIIVLFFTFFVPLNQTFYKETDYYRNTMTSLDSLSNVISNNKGDTLQIGWGKSSLVPSFITPLAGYGNRKGVPHLGIEDSVWVSAMVFDNGINRAAYISLDLLIVPPNLEIEKIVENLPIKKSQIFFTASHTHSSIGGFLPSIVGNMFAGKYDDKILNFITVSIRKALMIAINDLEVAKVGFAKISAENFIKNRLVGDSLGEKDSWIRLIKLEKKNDRHAILFSYSAHATCFSDKQLKISSDYPGRSISLLERLPNVEFAIYGAGSVGSMAPNIELKQENDKVNAMAQGIVRKIVSILDSIPTFYQNELIVNRINIQMRDPSFRLNKFISFRPWLFNYLVGKSSKYFSFLKLGNILIIGTPSDFSGELARFLDEFASKKKINLIINSFNGGYVGYITKDQWYDKTDINTYETYTMNWFGPDNGNYFTEIIENIITINEKK